VLTDHVLPLEHGFETDTLALISEQDILGDRLARPRKKRAKPPTSSPRPRR
jgi:transcription-repair coupling factor (superfamily II helicase)